MSRNIKYAFFFGILTGIMVSLIEILMGQLRGNLGLNIIYHIYKLNIIVALGISLILAIFVLHIAKIFLSPSGIAKKKLMLLSFPIPFMLSLFLPKIFIDYFELNDSKQAGNIY